MAILEREFMHSDSYDHTSGRVPFRKFTRTDYYAMAEAGVLKPSEHTELIDGIIYVKGESDQMSPIGAAHVFSVNKIGNLLREAGIQNAAVLLNASIVLDDVSEPEPDVVLVRGELAEYSKSLPTTQDVLLAVEVSYSTLAMDSTEKAAAYARSGILEYWIVNLVARELVVHRDPQPDGTYAVVVSVGESGFVSPLAKPDVEIAVAAILP